jgi:ABC-2 type transport system ATP-binding protein
LCGTIHCRIVEGSNGIKGSAVLSAHALTKRFGDRTAVEHVSFDVGAGEILALLGPNGAGKTTTLRMLGGLIAPTSGAVHLDDEQVDLRAAARLRTRVGFLTEAPGLWERLTVRENLLTYARLHGLPRPGRAVDEALSTFGIAERRDDVAAQLSKGLKQRVALARTLLHQPSIVLLDEPTSGLDPESARTVREMIVQMRADGRAVLLSTHNLDEVERVADRVAVLRQSIVALDTPSALRARLFGARVRIVVRGEASRFVKVVGDAAQAAVEAEASTLTISAGSSGATIDTPSIVRILVGVGADIESVSHDAPRLEDVYLRLLERTHS